MIVEICVDSFYGGKIAEENGADRIELNSSLSLGGLTPFYGLLDKSINDLSIPIVVMLRNRPAGFSYRDFEYEEMLNELQFLVKKDIEGIAFGFLNDNFTINKKRTKELVHICHDMGKKAVFHRAFDNTIDPFKAIEELIDLKVDRVLTSGQKETSIEGKNLIKNLQDNYGNDIDILAGGGLNSKNIEDFLKYSHVNSVHSSCRKSIEDKTSSFNISYAYKRGKEKNFYDITNEKEVKDFVKRAKSL